MNLSRSLDLSPPADPSLVRRQLAGILRLELRRNLFSRQSFAVYFLAFAPVALMFLWAIAPFEPRSQGTEIDKIFAGIFEGYLRVPVFLSTLFIFMSLFRSEILQRSLHYYLLTPVRREILVLGKYLAAVVSTWIPLALSTSALTVLFRLRWGTSETASYFSRGSGVGHLLAYLGVTLLACAGYGALFLLVGLFFRNPVVPAAVIWSWEFISFLLPPLLKRIGVIHYLRSLYPIPFSAGGFLEIVSEPTPAYLAVPGLLVFTVAVLAIAAWRVRSMELDYGSD